ncbi:F-box-like domain protein [Ceratobasidium sp. AG-Ba]|nr:F-box-like domain protein [Ceratobasidium sp. AG-Ba]
MIPEYGYGVSFSDTINSIAPRISRLEIHSEAFYACGLQPLLARLLKLCSNKTLKDLVVHAKTDGSGSDQLLPWRTHYLVRPPSKAETDELLIPLRTLHLSSAMIPWDSSAYHSLTELSLSWADSIPLKLLEFREILSKCPELCMLRLKVGYFNYSTTPGTIEPIELKNLHTLILTGTASSDITEMLDFLRPGGQELAIRTDIPAASSYVTRVQRFFESATTITKLHVRPQSKALWFNALSCGLHTLSKLTLSSCHVNDLALREYTGARPEEVDNGLWPTLHTLCLNACWIDFALLRALVQRTRVKYLIFLHCMTEQGGAISLKMIQQHFGDLEVQTMMENSRKKVDNWSTHWIW